MDEANSIVKVKVVVVGDAGVGKTSLAVRFTDNSFMDRYKQTVGASFCSRALNIENKTVVFQIWDTAGQERFRSLVPMYLRDAEVALLVYDISSYPTFSSIEHWIRQLQQYGPVNLKCAIIGNKIDLDEFRQVPEQEALSFADLRGLYFEETSAKSGEGVNKVFTDIGNALVAEHKYKPHSSTSSAGISLTESYIHQRRSKCC